MKSTTVVFVFLAIEMIASQETGVTPSPSPVTPSVKIPDPSPITQAPVEQPSPITDPSPTPVNPDPSPTPINPDPSPTPINPDPSPTTQTPIDQPSPITDPSPTPVNPDPSSTPINPDPSPTPINPDPSPTPVNPDPSTTTTKPQLTSLYILNELVQSSLKNNRIDSKCVQALPDKTLANKIQTTLEHCMYVGRQPDRRLVAKLAWEVEKHSQDIRGIRYQFRGLQRWIHESAENVRFQAVKASLLAQMVRSRMDTERVERVTKECARDKLQDELEGSNADLGPIRDCLNNKIF